MKKRIYLLLHWLIILNFLVQILYSASMVFFVVRPEGVRGPLLGSAKNMAFEMMVTRRLYAIEFWIAFSGLAIYLALTEFKVLFPKKEE
ncbi:MAG: hypothetical protein D6785_03320, partial [Planctomycetota bacterium]